jgi:multidrug resistance efflux pump
MDGLLRMQEHIRELEAELAKAEERRDYMQARLDAKHQTLEHTEAALAQVRAEWDEAVELLQDAINSTSWHGKVDAFLARVGAKP